MSLLGRDVLGAMRAGGRRSMPSGGSGPYAVYGMSSLSPVRKCSDGVLNSPFPEHLNGLPVFASEVVLQLL